MRERRGSPRHRCRLRCVVRRGAKREEATILDVSLSGLSLQTGMPLAQGDEVEIEVSDGGRVLVRALAWNVRRVRRGQETLSVTGMMLAEVGPDYEALVIRTAGSRAARSPRDPGRAPAPPAPAQPRRAPPPALLSPRRLPWWRLRVKQANGSRTRMVTLAAESAEDAATRSLAELGEGWEVMEVRPAAG
jgi:hypothetical protein